MQKFFTKVPYIFPAKTLAHFVIKDNNALNTGSKISSVIHYSFAIFFVDFRATAS